MKGMRAGTVALGTVVLAAGMLAGFASAANGVGPPNQGNPPKVTAVFSGYVCEGTIIWRDKIIGDGQAKTVNITETLPIVEVRVKSGSKAALVSAVFSGNFLSATVTISQGVGNHAWSVCLGGPPDQGDPDKVTAVFSGYVCSGTIIWRGLIQGDGQAKTVNITETLPIVEVRVASDSIAALVSAVFSGNFLSATVTISQGVTNYAWSVCQPGNTT
jgi:hypothetical protein